MRDLDTIKTQIVDDVLALRKDVRLVQGDLEYDVIVESTAPLFYRYEVLLEFEDRTRNLVEFKALIADDGFKSTLVTALGTKQDGTSYTLDDVNALISSRLDAYVKDFNVIRSTGTNATGTVAVYLTDASAASWNSNTEFTSGSGAGYQATSAITNVIPNFSTVKGAYYVIIPIQATAEGQASNATAGSIRTMSPKPSSFSYCTNESAITGGSDGEEDLELISRTQGILASKTNGSLPALTTLAKAQSYVDDVLALDDDDQASGIYVGSVCDLFTQFTADNTELVEEIFYWPGVTGNTSAEEFVFTPSKQPVVSTVTPTVFVYLSDDTEVQVTPGVAGTDFETAVITVDADSGTFVGSVKSQTNIRVNMILNTGSGGTQYQRRMKVLYLYDKNPYKLQAVINDPQNKMVGPEALVKKAVAIPYRIIVEPAISFGFIDSQVQAAIVSNLSVFFNGGTTSYGKQFARKRIGEKIVHTDVAQVILRTEGVVSYDADTFRVINTITGDLTDPSVVKNNQYPTLFDVLFTFNTFNLSNFTAAF